MSILQNLHHPSCEQYVSAVRTDSELRVVTEFYASSNLEQWVKRLPDRKFPCAMVLPLALSLLQALEYLHLKRIVHRDVEPANILMTEAGVPRLTGFDVSCNMIGTLHACAGSPAFMAPEVMVLEDGAEEEAEAAGYTEKADVWSLGATLFTLIAGNTLFAVIAGGEPPIAAKGAIKRSRETPRSGVCRLSLLGRPQRQLRSLLRCSSQTPPPGPPRPRCSRARCWRAWGRSLLQGQGWRRRRLNTVPLPKQQLLLLLLLLWRRRCGVRRRLLRPL